MALRLAGERFLTIQGADSQGWVREVTVQDSLPGLKVNQKGTGRVFDFQDGGVSKMYLPDGGNVTLSSGLVFTGGNITGGSGFQIATSAGDLILNPAGVVGLNAKALYDIGAAGNQITATAIKLAASGSIAAVNATNPGVQNVGGNGVSGDILDNQSFTVTMNNSTAVVVVMDSAGVGAVFVCTFASATIVELADPSGLWSVTDADTNPGWAIFKGASSHTFTIKNYMNATRQIYVNVLGAVASATAPA